MISCNPHQFHLHFAEGESEGKEAGWLAQGHGGATVPTQVPLSPEPSCLTALPFCLYKELFAPLMTIYTPLGYLYS